MRLLPIVAAITLISTAAFAKNMDTSNTGNPNRPGHTMGMSSHDGMHHRMTRHQKMMHKKMMQKKMRDM